MAVVAIRRMATARMRNFFLPTEFTGTACLLPAVGAGPYKDWMFFAFLEEWYRGFKFRKLSKNRQVLALPGRGMGVRRGPGVSKQRGNARLHEELNGSAADFSQRSERGGMRKLAVEQDILDLLRSADGVTTHDVAERLAISISTASKYLEALKREGRVAYTPVGPAKVWRLPEAMPALQDFDHLKRNLTLSSNGAVRLFEERAAIAPAEGLRALHRELERADPAVARRALYALGHAMGRHVAGAAAGRTKA